VKISLFILLRIPLVLRAPPVGDVALASHYPITSLLCFPLRSAKPCSLRPRRVDLSHRRAD
jgi:hypothetical protein